MSTYTPEEAKERRRASVRASVAKHSERLASLSPIERAAWKARASLGEDYDPYTPAEREKLDEIRKLRAELETRALWLNEALRSRYRKSLADNPSLVALLAELEAGTEVRINLPPH